MRNVQLVDTQTDFTEYIQQAERGETVTLLRGDRPVAQIIPFPQPTRTETEREIAWERVKTLMLEGTDLGGVWEGRDVLYDRD